uniref:A-kinase anchor protein 7 RI-RII subunit-binding domain-containing protein n=1 Tax=Sus scrofa TaxID=9823 RepID=A0A8D2BR48_PIG
KYRNFVPFGRDKEKVSEQRPPKHVPITKYQADIPVSPTGERNQNKPDMDNLFTLYSMVLETNGINATKKYSERTQKKARPRDGQKPKVEEKKRSGTEAASNRR